MDFADQWVFSLSVADLKPFGSRNSLLKRRNLCGKQAVVDLKSPPWLFHFCGLRFGVYYAQISTKSEASRKSRADLEGNSF